MKLVHAVDGEERVLAEHVHVRDGLIGMTRGLMGAPRLDAREAVAFRFRRPSGRRVHTLFVRETLDIVWIVREEVVAVETLEPWSTGRRVVADTVIELAEGKAADVSTGSVVRLIDEIELVDETPMCD